MGDGIGVALFLLALLRFLAGTFLLALLRDLARAFLLALLRDLAGRALLPPDRCPLMWLTGGACPLAF